MKTRAHNSRVRRSQSDVTRVLPAALRLSGWLLVTCTILGVLAGAVDSPEPVKPNLVWRADQNRVDADVDGVALPVLLETLAQATGWAVFVEPDVERNVTTRFKGLNATEALGRLFGDLNFALVSRTNAPPALFIYSTTMAQATQAIVPLPARAVASTGNRAGQPIANELVVTLKKGGPTIEEIARRLGAKVVGRIEGTDTYRLGFDNETDAKTARSALTDGGEVDGVDFNYTLPPPPQAEFLATSMLPPSPIKARPVGEGNKVIVGLVDTPVQTAGINFKDFLLTPLAVVDLVTPAPGQLTHGTSMAETIVRGLSQSGDTTAGSTVRILPVDVYGSAASTTTFDVARGIQTAIKGGANVINLSLSSDADTPYLRRLIVDAHGQGVLFVGAAGNQPVTTPSYPAAYPEVLATTAGDRSGRIASYANRGEFVDVIAPGTGLVHLGNQTFVGSGTSYSAAYVTGIAAGLGESGKTAAQIELEIRSRLSPPAAKP